MSLLSFLARLFGRSARTVDEVLLVIAFAVPSAADDWEDAS